MHDRPASESDQSVPRMRIYSDEVKHQHVGHWDLDYLPREQLDKLLLESESRRHRQSPKQP
ncbi:MAG: hypothetical protein CMJ58_02335 [Planctomycetaceae bacterium]|nr:hypothetical protein [Planctomycetaceae bacterium]